MLVPAVWCTSPIHSADPVPFFLALMAFFFADGIIGYRLIYQGGLTDLHVLNRTYVALGRTAVLVLAGFLLYWSDGGYQLSRVRSTEGG